jgi:hypothetical protein
MTAKQHQDGSQQEPDFRGTPGNPRRGGTVTAHGCAQQVSAAFAALPGSRVLTWDGAQRMVTAFAGFRRLTASAPQPKCDLGYVE